MRQSAAAFLLLASLTAPAWTADLPTVNRFESEADCAGLPRDCSPFSLVDGGVSGRALAVECLFRGNWLPLRPPRELEQGVVTLWLRDPLFAKAGVPGGGMRDRLAVHCREVPGGPVRSFSLDTGRESPYWWFIHDGPDSAVGQRATLRHDGWTRFDIIAPAGGGTRPFIVCIDGREALRTPRAYASICEIGITSGWGGGTILADDFASSPDPAAYRPNVLQAAACGDEAGGIGLRPEARLPLAVTLDRAGARAERGEVTLRLLDGREQEVARTAVAIDWKTQAGPLLAAELPPPPRSGRYRVAAEYRDAGLERPDALQAPVEVRFATAGWEADGRARLPLELPWAWLPQAVPLDGKGAVSLPATAPAAPPADWSAAERVAGCWYTGFARQRHAAWAGWYRRSVAIPADWRGRRIALDVDDVQTRARVFADGRDCGAIDWPGGEVDLSAVARPGATLDLCLYVTCFRDAGYAPVLAEVLGGDARLPDWLAQVGSHRGLRGQVALVAGPAGAQVGGVAIATPGIGEQAMLKATIEAVGLVPGRSYRVRAVAASAGRPAKELPTASFTAISATAAVELAASWRDARRWDLGAPWLYDLVARLEAADGAVLDTALPVRFGVRDLRFDGRLVRINGRTVNLFMPMVWSTWSNPGMAAHMDRHHFNFSSGYHQVYYFGAGNGGTHRIDEQLDFSDEAGLGTDLPVSSIFLRQALAQQDRHEDPRYWAMHQRVLDYAVRRHRNRPGLFFYDGPAGGGNLTMGCMFNPLLMDGQWIKDFSGSPLMARKLKAERRAIAGIRAADPTRPIVAQDSGNVTDATHITHYAGFMPNQELIESTGPWVERGAKPWFVSEQTAPFGLNWTNACRAKGHHTDNRVECVGEWAAIDLGDDAFARDARDREALRIAEDTALRIRERAQKAKPIADPAARARAWADMGTYHPPMFPADYLMSRHRIAVEGARHREQWLHWRADGIGLLCAWGMAVPEMQESALAPLTGFLAGPPGRRTQRPHVFAPGETLERGAVLLNNGRDPRTLTVAWRLELDGTRVAGGESAVTVPAGGVVEHLLSAAIPAGGDRLGRLVLELSEAGRAGASDSADIEVLAPRRCRAAAPVALIDPEGDSARALAAAGVRFRQVPFGADLAPYQVVVFGRRAFRYELKALPDGVDLGALTRAGKRVLVLEQDEATLRERFRFRTEYISARAVYGRIGGHAALDGLPDRALRSWRGAATLTDGHALAREADLLTLEHNGARWFYEWNDGTEHARPVKWGNTHNVATVMVIKPDSGRFRTLIDGEYAHNYAAAWELETERGRVVFCQLDVSGRTAAEPAAARLLANLVEHCAGAPAPQWRGTAYLGGPTGAALLAEQRVPHRAIAAPAEAQAGELLVLGEADPAQLTAWRDGLAAHAAAGGTVFSLPKPAEAFAAGFTPFAASATAAEVEATLLGKPGDPLLAGLGNGDLYWKGFAPVAALAGLPAGALTVDSGILAKVPTGTGAWVLCQFSPATFDVDARFWQREPQQWAGRAIRQMLGNCGAAMEPPRLLAAPRAQAETVATVDLAGGWKGCAAPDEACPPPGDARWQPIAVPGFWEGQRPEWARHDGFFWYRRTVDLAALPPGADVRLLVGAIKDEDDTYVNGRLVGHVGRDTHVNDYFEAQRDYALPAGLLRAGGNEIAIRVRNIAGQGGIAVAPVQLLFTRSRRADLATYDLAGTWQAAKAGPAEACPPPGDPRWHPIRVPGSFQEQHRDWAGYNGVMWYRRTLVVDAVPEDVAPVLTLGAVDDEDDTFVNGEKVGHTGTDTNPKNYWMAKRVYTLPPGLLKPGANELRVRCNDLRGSGGITEGPVRLSLGDPEEAARRALAETPYLRRVGKADDPYCYNGW